MFARIRQELDDGKAERKRSAGIKRGRKRFPPCSRFECSDPAVPGNKLCLYHMRRANGTS